MTTEEFPQHIGTVVNEALQTGVPAIHICGVLDMVKIELQMRIISHAAAAAGPQPIPRIVRPGETNENN